MMFRLPKTNPWLFVVNVVGVVVSFSLIPGYLLFGTHKPLTLANTAPILSLYGLIALGEVIRQIRKRRSEQS